MEELARAGHFMMLRDTPPEKPGEVGPVLTAGDDVWILHLAKRQSASKPGTSLIVDAVRDELLASHALGAELDSDGTPSGLWANTFASMCKIERAVVETFDESQDNWLSVAWKAEKARQSGLLNLIIGKEQLQALYTQSASRQLDHWLDLNSATTLSEVTRSLMEAASKLASKTPQTMKMYGIGAVKPVVHARRIHVRTPHEVHLAGEVKREEEAERRAATHGWDLELDKLLAAKPRLKALVLDLRAAEYDLWRSSDIAARRGTDPKTAPQNARNMRERGAIFGVEVASNTWRYPSFQFDNELHNLKPGIARVLSVVPPKTGGLALLSWFLTPQSSTPADLARTRGKRWTPLSLLGRDDDRLVALAKAAFEQRPD